VVKQYDVCKLSSRKGQVNYVIILQSTDFAALTNVIVAPLRLTAQPALMDRLHIAISVEGEQLHIHMAEMAAHSVRHLGEVVDNASRLHVECMSAIDLLFAGF
jgi:hypothetical protein